jgi:hypothetical protein
MAFEDLPVWLQKQHRAKAAEFAAQHVHFAVPVSIAKAVIAQVQKNDSVQVAVVNSA